MMNRGIERRAIFRSAVTLNYDIDADASASYPLRLTSVSDALAGKARMITVGSVLMSVVVARVQQGLGSILKAAQVKAFFREA